MSKKKGKNKSILSMFTGGLISLIMVGVVLAGLQLMGVTSLSDSLDVAKKKALKYSECIPSGECGLIAIIKDVDLSSGEGIDLGIDSPGKEKPKDVINLPDKEGIKLDSKNLLLDRNVKGYKGPEHGEPYVNVSGLVNKDESQKMLTTLKTVSDKEDEAKDVSYSRKEWKHWLGSKNNPCWNTREEVLYRDAIPGSLKFVDKNKKVVKEYEKACAIGSPVEKSDKIKIETEDSGKWIDPYSGKKIKDSGEIDVDHIIPLSNAARNGGQKWTLKEKESFANDLSNLLATSAKENRSKGDKGPGKYMPPSKDYHCQYAKSYITLSYKYDLTITKSDYKALSKAVKSCKN